MSYATTQKAIYVYVGGKAGDTTTINVATAGGYNGGGNAINRNDVPFTGGGGATHIATVSGLLKNLSSYKNTGGTNISKEILIVAGGGGGTSVLPPAPARYGYGGNGGGYIGNNGRYGANSNCESYGKGGTQTSDGGYYILSGHAYTNSYNPSTASAGFGYGGSGDTTSCPGTNNHVAGNGGGGGWYGGHGSICLGGGGGGSGYIGSSNLISGGGITKHMTCYSCTTSTAAATRTNSNTNAATSAATADRAKLGNGYARITYLGTSI